MKKYIFVLCVLCICIPRFGFAETVIGGLYTKPTIWSRSGSPYIVRDSTVFLNTSLRVEAGVEVRFEKSLFLKNSSLTSAGTERLPIILKADDMSSYIVSGEHSKISMLYTNMTGSRNSHFLNMWKDSSVVIDHSTIDSFGGGGICISAYDNTKLNIQYLTLKNWSGKGIEIFSSSSLVLKNSNMIHVDIGVYSFDRSSIDVQDSVFQANTIAIQIQASDAVIHTTDFEQNERAIVQDVDTGSFRPISATSNWFGTSTNPDLQRINKIEGNIHFTPWSYSKNRKDFTLCCSNVLFFPGLMGSRLYQKSGRFENQLWEPNRNTDVKKLFMSKYGEALEPGIYTRDILSKTNIFGGVLLDKSIYKDFVINMNSLVSKRIIRQFKSVPYDWRFSPDVLLKDGILTSNGTSTFTQYIYDSIRSMAKDSKTGKVTLITHSNGGLVVKYILAYAKEHDIELPVDKVIYVGMPEHGTPQAITSLVFGHEQAIAGGLILKSSVARDLGRNMPTAYMLLPQKKYFDTMVDSMSVGASMAVYSQEQLKQTLKSGFPVFNQDLFEKAKRIHEYIQNSNIDTVQEFQIVGVGVPTVTGFLKHGIRAIPKYNNDGDGVVQRGEGRTGIVRQSDLSETGFSHINMMNARGVLEPIQDILVEDMSATSNTVDIKAATYERFIIEDVEPLVDPIELRFVTTIGKPISYKNSTNSFVYSDGGVQIRSFDGGVEYLQRKLNQSSSIEIKSKSISHIHMYRVKEFATTGNIQVQTYENIPAYTETVLHIGDKDIDITIPDIGIEKRLEPSSIVNISSDGSTDTVASSTTGVIPKSFQEELIEVKQELAVSTVGFYLKMRYVRYIDQILKNKADMQKTLIVTLMERIKRSIKNIDRYSNNPSLKSRYSASRRDYVHILYILSRIIAK